MNEQEAEPDDDTPEDTEEEIDYSTSAEDFTDAVDDAIYGDGEAG